MSGVSIFVSHISEEAEVAAALRGMLEKDFLGLVRFFASTDIRSIGAGEDWLSAIKTAMNKAKILLVLCSQSSVEKPWVQFEIGAAWMKGLLIVPVCHSGMTVDELEPPLSQRHGVELGTALGLERLYARIAERLQLPKPPELDDLPGKLNLVAQVERRFRARRVQQFERFIDIVIPPGGLRDGRTIPDDAKVISNAESLKLFGLFDRASWTWKDIVDAAQGTPDTRWLTQLEQSIRLASNDKVFRPVQAVYHGEHGSYQPQLLRKEILVNGDSRFHVHLVDTVVAPLADVPGDFGVLATLLRLGLRFRYEVIDKYRKLAGDDTLDRLREAVETIEIDAHSRGAENIDIDVVLALFDRADDRAAMERIQQDWNAARERLFRDVPAPGRQDLVELIAAMRDLNHRFMTLGTRRFHEMVRARWAAGEPPAPLAPLAAAA